MRVLSATGIEELDRELADVLPQHGITVAGDCYSRLVLTKVAMELEADTVIISPLLKNGENDLVQVIVNLRDKGIRVIVLPGHPEMVKTQELIKKLVPYGVYDYVYDKVGIKNIIERLMNPAALGDIPKQLIDAAAMQKAGEEISEEIKRQFLENEDVKIKKKPVIDKPSGKDDVYQKKMEEKKPREESKTSAEVRFRIKAGGKVKALKDSMRELTKDTISTVGSILEERMPGKTALHRKTTEKMVITVWSPSGDLKSFTALNLAIVFKVALLNFDLTCPMLDTWFGIKQSGIEGASEKDAGILTLGENMSPALVPRMLREIKWGIRYLPAGTKIGNIGTPDYGERALETFKEIIEAARDECATVVVDAGRDMEMPATFAALTCADVIIIPTLGMPQEIEVLSWQLNELYRLGINKPTLELVFSDNAANMNKVCQKRIQLNIDLHGYKESSCRAIPYCLLKGEEEWGEILQYIKSL